MRLVLLLFVPILVFGFEINFNKQFTSTINPDKLSTRITIHVVKDNERYVAPILNKFNDFIKDFDLVKKRGGTFSISPKYQYTKGHSSIIGYSGTLRYSIFATTSDTINEFIKQVLELKNDRDVSISVSTLKWIVSKDKYSNTLEALRLKSILWAKEYVAKLGDELNTSCTIKKININSRNRRPSYRANNTLLMMESPSVKASIPVPEQTKDTINLNPNYVMECK